MKIVFLVQDEPFYLPTFFNTVLSERKQDVVQLALLEATTGKDNKFQTAKRFLGLYGFWNFTLQTLKYFFLRFKDKTTTPSLNDKVFYSVEAAAKAHRVPIARPGKINSKAFREELEKLEPDLMISVACPQIIGKKLLAIPKMGTINIHGGALPKYRGMMPSFWVLANGEKEAASTVHYVNESLDDGAIIAQKLFPIEPDDTQDSLIRRSKAIGARLLLDVIDQFEKGTVETRENDSSQATYFTFPTPEDVLKFKKAGRKFF